VGAICGFHHHAISPIGQLPELPRSELQVPQGCQALRAQETDDMLVREPEFCCCQMHLVCRIDTNRQEITKLHTVQLTLEMPLTYNLPEL